LDNITGRGNGEGDVFSESLDGSISSDWSNNNHVHGVGTSVDRVDHSVGVEHVHTSWDGVRWPDTVVHVTARVGETTSSRESNGENHLGFVSRHSAAWSWESRDRDGIVSVLGHVVGSSIVHKTADGLSGESVDSHSNDGVSRVSNGWVSELGEGHSTGGRPGTFLHLSGHPETLHGKTDSIGTSDTGSSSNVEFHIDLSSRSNVRRGRGNGGKGELASLSVSSSKNISDNTEFKHSGEIGGVGERQLPVLGSSTLVHDNTVKAEAVFGLVRSSSLDESVRSGTPDNKGPIPLHFTVEFFKNNSSSVSKSTSETFTKVGSVVLWNFNNSSSVFVPRFKDSKVESKTNGTFIHNVGHGSVESNGSVGSWGVSGGWNTGSRWISTGVVDEGRVVGEDGGTEELVVTSDVRVIGGPDGGTENLDEEVFVGFTKSNLDSGGVNVTNGDSGRVGGTGLVTIPDLTDGVSGESHGDESIFEDGLTDVGFESVVKLGFEGESTLGTSGEWFESDRVDFEVHLGEVSVLFHGESNWGTRVIGGNTSGGGNSLGSGTSSSNVTGGVTSVTGGSSDVGSSVSSDNSSTLSIGPVSDGKNNITSSTGSTVGTDVHGDSWVGDINRDGLEVSRDGVGDWVPGVGTASKGTSNGVSSSSNSEGLSSSRSSVPVKGMTSRERNTGGKGESDGLTSLSDDSWGRSTGTSGSSNIHTDHLSLGGGTFSVEERGSVVVRSPPGDTSDESISSDRWSETSHSPDIGRVTVTPSAGSSNGTGVIVLSTVLGTNNKGEGTSTEGTNSGGVSTKEDFGDTGEDVVNIVSTHLGNGFSA
jgi:hypothetical protein